MSSTDKRQRTLTEKGEEYYQQRMSEKGHKIEQHRVVSVELLRTLEKCVSIEELKDANKRLLQAHGGYSVLVDDLADYLEGENTEQSLTKLADITDSHKTFENIVTGAEIGLEFKMTFVFSTKPEVKEQKDKDVTNELSKVIVVNFTMFMYIVC